MDKEIRNTGENFQETEFLKLKKPADDRIVLIEDLNENSDKIDKFCKDMENNKQNKNDASLLTKIKTIVGAINELFNSKLEKGGYVGDAKNLNDEISKKASKTALGRIIVGDNLIVDETGRLSGNPAVDISGKLDKGNVTEKYNTAEKIGIELDKKQNSSDSGLKTNAKTVVGAINENYEKFKNFCPYEVGDIYITTLSTNPATRFLSTTWEKIEGKFLFATSGSNTSGQVGGSNTKTITKINLPNIKLQIDNFYLTTAAHSHMVRGRYIGAPDGWEDGNSPSWAGYLTVIQGETGAHQKDTFSGGGENTGTASPYTSNLGSGTPLDITPAYYTAHIWKRLS